MKPIKPDCSAQVFRGWHYYPCGRKASVEIDGRHYCGTHNPAAKAARDEKRETEWKAKRDIRNAQWRLQGAAPELLAVCKRIHDELTLGSEYHEQLAAAIAKAEGRA